MQYILLSTDGPISLYEVPEEIAKELTKYCIEFLKWAENGPEAKRFKKGYRPEQEFINYINNVVNKNCIYKSQLIKTIANTDEEKLQALEVTEPYKDYPYFNF